MQGKRKIIDDILASARAASESVIEEATAEQTEALEQLRKELDEQQKANAEKAARAAESAYAGRLKLGELEAGKIMLEAKQRCVAAVYDGVRSKILGAPDGEYLALIGKLIAENCEDGDTVIASASDKRITEAWIKKVSTAAKKKLTLSKTRGDFSGGVILRNDRYDRSLTVDDIVEELKDRTVADTAAKLGL